MTERARRRALAGLLAAALAVAAMVLPAGAAEAPYEQRWRIQSEVGGDFGGRSEVAVNASSVTIAAEAGAYVGTVTYSDRLVVEDPQGGVFVQVSRIGLDLTGVPAGGGSGMGGLFEGTARLDDYLGLTWKQATSGDLPDKPSRSGTYRVAGRWAAFLSGGTAEGELLFESASVTAKTGDLDTRDSSWFNRFGATRAQSFRTTVEGTVASGGTGAGPGAAGRGAATGGPPTPFAYLRAGFGSDVGAGSLAAVPLESALSARALQDAKLKGATALPANSIAIDLDVSGLLLDAKNRAAGQRADSAAAQRAAAVWSTARRTSALASTESTTSRLSALLKDQTKTVGAKALLDQVNALAADPSLLTPDVARMLSEWLAVALAVDEGARSVLGPSSEAVEGVRSARIPRSGAVADGLLADADSPSAPAAALQVGRFDRREDGDVDFVDDGKRVIGLTGLIPEVLASAPLKDKAPAVSYVSLEGNRTLAPGSWLAYRRADGVDFWLAGDDGPAAMRDATLAGWAFTSRGMRVVSAARCGQTLAMLRAGAPRASSGK